MRKDTERDDLADLVADSIFRYTGVTTSSSKTMADELLTEGYRKPEVLSYVVVDRLGVIIGKQSADRADAQAVADEWTTTCKEAGIDWEYRVAEIVEAAK